MYQGIGANLYSTGVWLAQGQIILEEQDINVDPDSLAEASIAIDGPQFFMALIAGVLLAFAFQLLMTNLGVAIGISSLGGSSDTRQTSSSTSSHSGPAATIRKIETGLGLATLISVSIALFAACWLAVELSLVENDIGIGIILGLVIWATYFTLLVWVSSTTIGSFVGSVVNAATSGFQALLGTATAAIGGTGAAIGTAVGGMAAKSQTVSTAESAARAVRQELMKGLDPEGIREKLEDYVETLRPPQLDYHRIQSEIEGLLNDPNFQDLTSGDMSRVSRETFTDLVSSRSDLSKAEVSSIVNIIDRVWNRTASQLPSRSNVEGLLNYVKEATPNQLVSDEFTEKLDELVQELRKRRKAQEQAQSGGGPLTILSSGLSNSLNSMMGIVLGRGDLSDLDAQTIVEKLKSARDQATETVDQVTAQIKGEQPSYSLFKADVENYLLNTYSWQMTQPKLEREFRDVIYDAEANPTVMAQELEQLNRSYFYDVLKQRGVFTVERMNQIAEQLEIIRLEALNTARAASEQGEALALYTAVENYLLSAPKEEFSPEKIQLHFKPLLIDPDADYDTLSVRLAQFDRPTLERILNQREDTDAAEAATIVTELEKARDRALAESQETQAAAKAKVEAQWLKVQSYLRDTGVEELQPENVKQYLQTLVNEPQAGMAALRARASHFDRESLIQLLSQREGISEQQVHNLIDQVESAWHQVRSQPPQLVGQAKEQYDSAMGAIAQYLRNTGKDELNPEGIKQDLQLLLDQPQLGTTAIRMRLAAMDRDTLVQLLSQRKDLSEEQVNRIINEVQETLRSVAKMPRRWAKRTQAQVMDFESTLEDYLRNTGKEELNPEGIKRDLNELVHSPRAGMSSLGDRLAKFDRSTLIAFLSEREDLSQEEATQIVDQIVGVRDQILEQFHTMQAALQKRVDAVIDTILTRIRHYLNSLDRPELNYEGVKQDVQLLFDDPEAGFEAMRLRLSQFDEETLKAVLESSPFLSQGDIDKLIAQIEASRNRVLQRAERIQRKTEERIEQVQHEAQKAAEETRKAAALAAWWLFATAFVSGVAAALGGLAAVLS
jgi:nucleoid DNA-binding protein